MGRLGIVAGILVLLAGAIVTRLFFLQVSQADEYQAEAERQYAITLLSSPSRGNIFFEDKENVLVPAAVTHKGFILEGNPQQISNVTKTYDQLSRILSLDKDIFLSRASTDATYTIFAKNITHYEASRIIELELEGIWLVEEERRMYPEGLTASHILGFVGYTENERTGRYGIEQQYEDILSGSVKKHEDERVTSGFFTSISNTFFSKPQHGYDIVLTIDPHIQSIVYTIATDLVEKWNAVSAGILIIEPKTGAIIAMESVPGFDPNTYGTVENYELFLNPLTQNIFEMGSIVKPLTMAAGLDSRSITEETKYYDAGVIQFGDVEIANYDGKGRGWQHMYDILDQSLNTGSVFIMQQLGERAFKDYMNRYGLGSVTGVDLPQEVAGNLNNLEIGGEVEYATASFGQGISVTPLGLASALSAMANGGELMKPYIVDYALDGDTVIWQTEPVVRRRVLQAETSERISRMLSDVVDNTLAGGIVSMPRYRVAAKTGTAQIPNKDTSGYSDLFLHTFFGYAPAFDPQVLILLYLEEPRGVRYASQTLAVPFKNILEFIINYYEIPPDR
jgi:cell division protein FtsI (penicillin-binding protein 3)